MHRKQAAEVFAALAQPFKPDELEWRAGATRFDKTAVMMLPYITNRAIMDRLDQVVGAAYWREEYRSVRENSKGWICCLTIELTEIDESSSRHILTVSHEDAADETDIEPTKGGASDSMKRAAVKFGIGRYLYNLPQFWAPTVERGGKYFPDPKWNPTLPQWALPQGEARSAPPPAPAPPPKAQPAPAPAQPAKSQAPAAASSTRGDEDPDTGLPPGPPPFDIVTRIGVGQWKENPWSFLAMGSIGGRRHEWMKWAANTWEPNKPATKKVKALLAWMEGKAAKQENEANARRDHREEPGHLTDDELAGLYPPGSQPQSIWDDPETPPF